MAFEGDVATFPAGELFAWLARSRATGVLTLARGMTIRRFHLRAGQIRLVSSSEQEMLLGHLLIERKLVGPEELEKAVAGRGRSRARLGRLLMRGGLVKRAELRGILAEKVRRLLADALTWDEGHFLYEAGEARPGGRAPKRHDGIAVAVDLEAALAQIRSGRVSDAPDSYVAVDDSDVIESAPAGSDDVTN